MRRITPVVKKVDGARATASARAKKVSFAKPTAAVKKGSGEKEDHEQVKKRKLSYLVVPNLRSSMAIKPKVIQNER